ncbi:MAG: amidohydrolase family protein, partial [Myxococcales bacterium]|nr:amidohydrolase family protein [Myxococcales bacterium]
DLRLGDAVDEVLAAHRAASPATRGVRYMLTWHEHPLVHSYAPAPALTRDPQWRRGYAALARHELSFDAWVYHEQLGELAALARDIPEVRVVLCHVGTPVGLGGSFHGIGADAGARDRIRGAWLEGLAELAACPNVHCKLSGLTMPVIGFGFHERAHKPDVEELAAALESPLRAAIDAFGVERCMFASNFPVDKVSTTLDTLWRAFGRVVDRLELDDAARRRLFRDNARAFYRLNAAA